MKRIKHTLIYFSGSVQKPEEHVIPLRATLPHAGILLSFYDLRKRQRDWRRLQALKGL